MSTKYHKNIFLYVLSLLPIIIATPPYVGCCIIIIFFLNLSMILGTTFRFLINKINTGNTEKLLLLAFLIFITIIFKRLLVLFSPVLGMMLSLAVFFIPLSSLFLDYLFSRDDYNLPSVFGKNMKHSGLFSIALFFFFLLREIIAFGSISIPVVKGVKILKFLPWTANFWASIPGAFIIIAILLAIIIFIDKNLDIVRRKK